MKYKVHIFFCFLMAAILLACSCGVKFETGQTPDEAQASSKVTANDIKSDWARLINASSSRDVGFHLKNHLENISGSFIKYGFMLAEKWREGNEGRGEEIPVSEMRTVIENWITNDKLILDAWEDNIDFARTRMIEDGFYPSETISLFDDMVEQFNEIYNVILYPTGGVDNYEDQIYSTKDETENLIMKLGFELKRY